MVRRPEVRSPVDEVRIEAEIARIRSLSKVDLRTEWRSGFGKEVPRALTKDLLARIIIWDIQEKAFGGFDHEIRRLLDGYARGKPAESERFRRLKSGTEIVRDYQGERYTITVTPDGYAWKGSTYPSLTTVARAITGTNWNGPRFFGLRGKSRHQAAQTASALDKSGAAKK